VIPDPASLRNPGTETPRELLHWRPQHGVLSLYARIDPGDRSASWATELRNGLSNLIGPESAGAEGTAWQPLVETAERLQGELEREPRPNQPRGLIGFVEISRDEAEERWYGMQIPPPRTQVSRGPVAEIRPLLELLDECAPLGIAAISSDRVRLIDWRLGRLEQLHAWELEYLGGWRERKARKSRDPARGEAVSAAGRDQYDQRMEETRGHFAEQAGGLARAEAHRHRWREALLFGDERYVRRFAQGFVEDCRYVDSTDLINEPLGDIERRVEALLPKLNRERERSLIERIKEAAYAKGRSALGVQETFQALEEGRVEHLVYDAGRDYRDDWPTWEHPDANNGQSLIERVVELALSTRAAITPVEGEGAEALTDQGGMAALLRY
jgi:hypothetical protein